MRSLTFQSTGKLTESEGVAGTNEIFDAVSSPNRVRELNEVVNMRDEVSNSLLMDVTVPTVLLWSSTS